MVGYPGRVSQIPSTLVGALEVFNLTANFKVYVCCPDCCYLYLEGSLKAIPPNCTNDDFGVTCGAPLFDSHGKPIRRFFYHSPIDWLARLLQRPKIQEQLRYNIKSQSVDSLEDICDGQFARQLKDDEGTPILGQDSGFLLILNIDGYGATGSKANRYKGGPRHVSDPC